MIASYPNMWRDNTAIRGRTIISGRLAKVTSDVGKYAD